MNSTQWLFRSVEKGEGEGGRGSLAEYAESAEERGRIHHRERTELIERTDWRASGSDALGAGSHAGAGMF